MSKGQRERPEVQALHAEVGGSLGHGKDGLVHRLELPDEIARLQECGGWVVKISHAPSECAFPGSQAAVASSADRYVQGALFKQKKYDVLRHFLGDTIPESHFLVSNVKVGEAVRPAEITLQREAPGVRIKKLDRKQKSDPQLHENITKLMGKLCYMFTVVAQANAECLAQEVMDIKLDLGGVAKFARSKPLRYKFCARDALKTIRKGTPNMLVNPETFQLYCVDFDQGVWRPGMENVLQRIYEIDEHNQGLRRQIQQTPLGRLVSV